MGVLTIEFPDPIQGEPCPCCGGRTTRLTRFVCSDGNAHAVYYAMFADNHPERMVSLAVSLGEWGEDSTPAERLAFPLRLRAAASEYQVGLIDAADSPWRDVKFLGRMLDRDEALTHPWKDEVFHLTDHIVMEDRAVKEYLDGKNTGETGCPERLSN
jgi:hypothetical protein